MFDKWKRELKLIENLGKLYPEFNVCGHDIDYKHFRVNIAHKARWVYLLCEYHLKRRLSRLEAFIKENNRGAWFWYKHYFNITEEQCGKES